MNLLDRYIARQYLTNIVLLFVLLFSVVVVIDFSLNFDEFTTIAERMIRERGWGDSLATRVGLSLALVLDLWWPRLFQLFYYMLGLVLVGAMGFTAAQFVRHRELVAILAGGISLHRVMRPMLLVAAVMCGLQLIDSEVALPRLAPLLVRDKTEAGRHQMGAARVPLTVDGRGRLLLAESFDADREVIGGLWVWERDAEGLMTRRIRAQSAHWENGQWVLTGGTVEDRRPGASPSAPQPLATFDTDLDPTALKLRRFEGYSGNLSLAQIGQMLERLRAMPSPAPHRVAQLERVRSARVAAVLCNLLTLLICTPFFVRREPTNMIVQSLYSAPVAVVSLVGGLLGGAAVFPGLPASVGPFVPVMILAPAAVAAVTSVRT